MDENHIYEMTENECYPQKNLQWHGHTTTCNSATPVTKVVNSKKSWKCFSAVLAVATLFNFLLIVGVGTALFYYETKTAFEVRQLNQNLIGKPMNSSGLLGPPGAQGPPGISKM